MRGVSLVGAAGVGGVGGGAAAQGFTGQQDQPVDGEEDGCGQRFGEQGAEGVFQGKSGDADRMVAMMSSQASRFVGVGGDDAAGGDAEPMWVTPLQTSDHVKRSSVDLASALKSRGKSFLAERGRLPPPSASSGSW